MFRYDVRSVFAVALALLCVSGPASAQSDTGEIIISVSDAATTEPIADARTILVGPQTASSLTTAAGIIRYTDVPLGIYRVRVVKAGFTAGVSREFDVLPSRSINVRVALGATSGALKVIGSVSARSSVSVNSSDINENSPIRRLSDSLTDALDKIAGVSVTQDATDPNSPVTVSLNGHDESQTSVSLDGIPLSAPGSSANLRAIGTDLFAGSSVSTSPGAGSLGGGVNFRTLQPTQALHLHASGTTGTFDRSNFSVAATGSVGSLGIALQHTGRGANSPLTFQDYRDQSGLTYPHDGESRNFGDFAKFRYRFGDERTTFSGTALSNNYDNSAICARDVTVLPCGIGPGNNNFGRFAFANGSVQSLIGTVATSFTAYATSRNSHTDYANRYALLPPGFDPGSPNGSNPGAPTSPASPSDYTVQLDPSLSDGTTSTRGFAYSASIAAGRHTFALSGNTYGASNTNVPLAGSRFEQSYTNAIGSTSYQLSDSFKANDKLTLSPRLSLVNTTTLGTSLLGGFGAAWRPQAQDTFGTSLSVGSSQPSLNINRSYGDPVGARYDCQAGTAVVNGPGDGNGGAQSAVSVDANWTHQFLRSGGQISLDAFSQVQSGQVVSALIEEPAAYFPGGAGGTYLQTLYNVYNAPSVCGPAAAAPRVFVNESVAGTRRIYQGLNASGRFGIGRFFVVIPNYTLNVAKLTAASSRLENGPSTTIVGTQLPNRPMHRAGITFDGYLPRSGIELLANAQYTGANNQQSLGPYVTLAAGLSHGFGPGIVSLFENNIFDTYGSYFATDASVQPLPLSLGGGEFRTAAAPLAPRTLSLSYTLSVGGPKPVPALASVAPRGFERTPPALVATQAPGTRAGGGFGRLQAAPPPPGTDPLSLATTRPSCDAAAQSAAAPEFAAIRAYVMDYEAKTALPAVPNVTLVPHAARANASVPYYLELRPQFGRPGDPNAGPPLAGGMRRSDNGGSGGPDVVVAPRPGSGNRTGGAPDPGRTPPPAVRAFRSFAGCAYVTIFTSSEAKAKGIDVSSGRPGFLYVPNTGFVFVRPPELPQGGGSLKAGS